MTPPADPAQLPWLRNIPPLPLCDVPWFGNLVVLATGEVNFCCFSPASIGNLNEQPFDELWNGPVMRRIRRSLAQQEFPPECRSISCPIYRGDPHHHIKARTEGSLMGNDPSQEQRRQLVREGLRESQILAQLDQDTIRLRIQYSGPAEYADAYACAIVGSDSWEFLPSGGQVPMPFAVGIALDPNAPSRKSTCRSVGRPHRDWFTPFLSRSSKVAHVPPSRQIATGTVCSLCKSHTSSPAVLGTTHPWK